jgi:hypothetical protein
MREERERETAGQVARKGKKERKTERGRSDENVDTCGRGALLIRGARGQGGGCRGGWG